LDASALLALLRGEPGGQLVRPFLADAAMSTLNWAEVVGYYSRSGNSEKDIRVLLEPLPIDRVPFDEAMAYIAGMMLPITRSAGLSLGDRACLALAAHLGSKVVTADRPWKVLGSTLGIDVEVIR
jgi:PIN domain nuclease of toxin-antitoxin system